MGEATSEGRWTRALRSRTFLTALTAAITASIVAAGFAVASIPGPDGVVQACYKQNGDVRIVDSSGACKQQETSLSWNQSGPQGPAGPAGPPGAAGGSGFPDFVGAATLGYTSTGCGAGTFRIRIVQAWGSPSLTPGACQAPFNSPLGTYLFADATTSLDAQQSYAEVIKSIGGTYGAASVSLPGQAPPVPGAPTLSGFVLATPFTNEADMLSLVSPVVVLSSLPN